MAIFDRLVEHQNNIENFYKIYYEALDDCRKEMLEQEYQIRDEMTDFEE